MKPHQLAILGSLGVVLAASGFVMMRMRQPPPPPPPDALVLVPGKAIGPYALGMTREAVEALRPADGKKVEARKDEVIQYPYVATLRDGRVVAVSCLAAGNGYAIGGAWVPPAVDATAMGRGLAQAIGNCTEGFQKPEGLGGWSGPWYDCHGTRVEVDQGRGYVTVIVGQYPAGG